MKYYLLSLLIAMNVATFGQIPKSRAEIRIDELEASGVDTIIYFRSERFDAIFLIEDSCLEFEKEFFIWTHNGATYFEKIATCIDKNAQERSYATRPILNNTSKVFEIITSHYKKLEFEQIVPGVFKWSVDGKEVFEQMRTNHPTMFELIICLRGDRINKRFDKDALADSIGRVKNLNYAYNKSSSISLLKSQIESEIVLLESKNAFK